MRKYKRPCAVCGRSCMMGNGQKVCDACLSRAGHPGLTFDAYAVKTAGGDRLWERQTVGDLVIGLCAAAGSVAAMAGGCGSGQAMSDAERRRLASGVADCLTRCAQLSLGLGFPFGAVAQMGVDADGDVDGGDDREGGGK